MTAHRLWRLPLPNPAKNSQYASQAGRRVILWQGCLSAVAVAYPRQTRETEYRA
jgi:hypothetical protein